MTRGANSQRVNARLREELKEAADARSRLERRVKDAEKARDEADARLADALDNGHPELREAVAREQVKEQRIRELAETSERYKDYLHDTLRQPLNHLLRTGGHPGVYMTARFFALCHEVFGEEFYTRLFDAAEWPMDRDKRRSLSQMSVDEAHMMWLSWQSDYGAWRGEQAIRDAKKRRETAA